MVRDQEGSGGMVRDHEGSFMRDGEGSEGS